MKTLAILSSLGVMFGMSQRMIAQAVNLEPMSSMAQLGVCGGCLTILLLTIVRVIPKMASENRQSVEKAAEINRDAIKESTRMHTEAIGDLSDKIARQGDSQLSLLREVLTQKAGGS